MVEIALGYLALHNRALNHEYDYDELGILDRTSIAEAARDFCEWADDQRECYGGIGAGHCMIIAYDDAESFDPDSTEYVDITDIVPDCGPGVRRASAESVERVRAYVLDQLGVEAEAPAAPAVTA